MNLDNVVKWLVEKINIIFFGVHLQMKKSTGDTQLLSNRNVNHDKKGWLKSQPFLFFGICYMVKEKYYFFSTSLL
ncbi:MAG: hypothetical protein KGV59_05785 [Tenacibaculum sp.]|nr:hypothetical protein [Tenacibaculum sp.]